MSTDEFGVEFDILYDNIQSSNAPGLNLLQKSIFLTQGKEDVVKQFYSGNAGPYEANEEATQYLRSLTKQKTYIIADGNTEGTQYNFAIPDDCWFIIYEQAELKHKNCEDTEFAAVKAMTHNEFAKAMDNPFRRPDRRGVIRLTIEDYLQLYVDSDTVLKGYTIRYLSKPSKIYLKAFSTEAEAPSEWFWSNSPYFDSEKTNNGWDDYSSNACPDIPESLHRTILIKAVQLAKAVWM